MNGDLYYACKVMTYFLIVIIALIVLMYLRYDRPAQITALIGAIFCLVFASYIAAAVYSAFAAIGTAFIILFEYGLQLLLPIVILMIGLGMLLRSIFPGGRW